MSNISVKNQAGYWSDAFWTGKERLIKDLAKLVFGLSPLEVRLDNLGDDEYKYGLNLDTKRENFLTLLTQSLLKNGLAFMEELEANLLVLVSDIHKVPFFGC